MQMVQTGLQAWKSERWMIKSLEFNSAIPVVIFGAGMAEAAIRGALEELAVVYSAVTRNKKAMEHQKKANRHLVVLWNLGKLVVLSASPIALERLGFDSSYTGWRKVVLVATCLIPLRCNLELLHQLGDYSRYIEGVARALEKQNNTKTSDVCQKILTAPQITTEFLDSICRDVGKPKNVPIKELDLTRREKEGEKSLYNQYYVYYVPLKTAEYTYRGVYSTTYTIYNVATNLLRYGLVRKVAKDFYTGLKNEIADASLQIEPDKRFHRLFGRHS